MTAQRVAGALEAWTTRLRTLARALGQQPPEATDEAGIAAALATLVNLRDRRQVWLALSVLTGRFPEEDTVLQVARSAQADGRSLLETVRLETTPESVAWEVEVETDRVLVDVADTATTTMATGIQRVVREVAKRWAPNPSVRFVAWAGAWQAMRELTEPELARVRAGSPRVGDDPTPERTTVVVPWDTSYVLLEVSAEPGRASRLRSLARFSVALCTAICYDLIPVTSSETSSPGMTGVFSHYMSALKYFETICTISRATAVEYEGWRSMLHGAGLDGPRVVPVLLPASVGESSDVALRDARDRLVVGMRPLVLVVGSHEPRKNHVAVIHAAEVLWREGLLFSLSFIGGNSWRSDEFRERLESLQAAGRPVESISRASDDLLWAGYRLASFTVFPSLNEGFGLPVAESLAVGTPVITSGFGSTKEIAEDGGAVLVDPRDDEELIDAMRTLLTDTEALAKLRAEATARPRRTWDQYSEEVWTTLVPAVGLTHAAEPSATNLLDPDLRTNR